MSHLPVDSLLNSDDDDDYNLNIEDEEKLLEDEDLDMNEDVIDLEPGDELEDACDAEEQKSCLDTSSCSPKEENSKYIKFAAERPSPIHFESEESSKSVPNNTQIVRRNYNQHGFQKNGRGRGGKFGNRGNFQQRKPENKTVHINPHFKGNVPINSHARLKWHSNNQQSQFTNFKQPTARIAPWQGQNVNNNMIPQKQVDFQGHVFQNPAMNEYQTVQPFTQQVPQMTVPVAGYNTVRPTFFQNREVFAQPQPTAPFMLQPHIQQPPNQPFYTQPPPNMMTPPPYNQVLQSPSQYQITCTNFPTQQIVPQCIPVSNQQMPYNLCNQVPNEHYPVFQPPPSVNFRHTYEPPSNLDRPVHNAKFEKLNSKRYVAVKDFTQKRRLVNRNFDNQKRKKRTVDSSNLHEIKTVKPEEIPPQFVMDTQGDEEEDPEKEYLKKIEQQKQLRLQIQRQKEERRKQKAAEANAAESSVTAEHPSVVIQKAHGIVKQIKTKNGGNLLAAKKKVNEETSGMNSFNQLSNLKVKINTQLPNENENSSRIVRVKNTATNVALMPVNAVNTRAFLQNRTVLAKDQTLPSTPVVILKNLSATTTEPKIHRLCQGIGEVQVREQLR